MAGLGYDSTSMIMSVRDLQIKRDLKIISYLKVGSKILTL
jgi:hypothetical protein